MRWRLLMAQHPQSYSWACRVWGPSASGTLLCSTHHSLSDRWLVPAIKRKPNAVPVSMLPNAALGRAVLEALSALNDQLLGLGSSLAFHQGRPDKVLGRVASLLLAGGGAAADCKGPGGSGFTAVQQPQYDELALHYYLSADDGAAEVEAAVEAAVRAAAAQHGKPVCSRPSPMLLFKPCTAHLGSACRPLLGCWLA